MTHDQIADFAYDLIRSSGLKEHLSSNEEWEAKAEALAGVIESWIGNEFSKFDSDYRSTEAF